MATNADRVQKSVTHYEPGPLPENKEDLGMYIVDELNRLSNVIRNQSYLRLEMLHKEPTRPRNGDIAYADGTNWSPLSSSGVSSCLVVYDGPAGAWSLVQPVGE